MRRLCPYMSGTIAIKPRTWERRLAASAEKRRPGLLRAPCRGYSSQNTRNFGAPRLLSANGILHAAGRVLDLAGRFFGLSFGLRLRVAGHLAGCLFHGTFRLVRGAFDPVLIHAQSLLCSRGITGDAA